MLPLLNLKPMKVWMELVHFQALQLHEVVDIPPHPACYVIRHAQC